MKYSFIVPVFNRPDEVDELLESLCSQTLKDFEVVIVEDGSQKPCKDVCDKYADILDLHYYLKENSGPGQSRNYGVERAQGEYVIILDSDVVLPNGFMAAVDTQLTANSQKPIAAWGGPDASMEYGSRCCACCFLQGHRKARHQMIPPRASFATSRSSKWIFSVPMI